MASSAKFNADQFANMNTHVAGIIFVYAGKDGNDTAMHFSGKEYEMTAKTQDEFLRVMRNLKTAFWMVKEKETELREKNDGIRCKYRVSTPTAIYVNMVNNERAKMFKTECSDFSKFGFFPTKKDMERSARDKKKYIHVSTIAMLEALNFRVEFPKADEIEPAKPAATPAVTTAKPDAKGKGKAKEAAKGKEKVAEVKTNAKPEVTAKAEKVELIAA